MPAPIADRAKHNNAHIGIRLREDEKKLIEERAQAAGKAVGEWCREVLLSTVRFSPEYRALLAEFFAMRKIVLEMHSQQQVRQAPLSLDVVRSILQEADSNKFVMADKRIVSYLQE
jgi:hypothetical protein